MKPALNRLHISGNITQLFAPVALFLSGEWQVGDPHLTASMLTVYNLMVMCITLHTANASKNKIILAGASDLIIQDQFPGTRHSAVFFYFYATIR